MVGRLRQGVPRSDAQAELNLIAGHLAETYPATNRNWSVKVETLLAGINGDRVPLFFSMIQGATFFVLLVVCANVANLQFARGITRRPEIAMRTALGAGRGRLLRQLLTENILLGLIGGLGSLAVALVIGASLMGKGILAMLHLADGYRPAQTLTFNVHLPAARFFDTPEKLASWYRQSLERLRALPGAEKAEATTALPYSDNAWLNELQIENRPSVPGETADALRLTVSDGYFNAFSYPAGFRGSIGAVIERKRRPSFAAGDGSEPELCIARFPGANPLGHRIRMGSGADPDPVADDSRRR